MVGNVVAIVALQAALGAWGGPFVPPAPTSIFPPGEQGTLDKDVIRRVMLDHLDEVQACYGSELTKTPALAGRIMVQFTIAASGQVISSVLQSSTLGNARVEGCAVEAVRAWQFPRPLGGGVVIVSFPFVLTPQEETFELVPGVAGAGTVRVTRVAPGLFVHRSTDARGIPSNGLVATTKRGLLLIDTAWTEAETNAILAWGDTYLQQPWLGAVITHEHGDRDGGLPALQRRHIPIAALDLTVAKLSQRGVQGVTALFAARDGAHQDPRGFEAFYPGPGHAPDNIVLRFPTLVFGGCLVKSLDATELGFTGDANLKAWPEAIRKVRARYGDTAVVPGHGAVDSSGKAYQHTLDLLAKGQSH